MSTALLIVLCICAYIPYVVALFLVGALIYVFWPRRPGGVPRYDTPPPPPERWSTPMGTKDLHYNPNIGAAQGRNEPPTQGGLDLLGTLLVVDALNDTDVRVSPEVEAPSRTEESDPTPHHSADSASDSSSHGGYESPADSSSYDGGGGGDFGGGDSGGGSGD